MQALAARILGPGLVPFGDGPDGGREATFEGPIAFPNREAPWNGYGVLQAKFRQRPLGQPQDTNWALEQLKGELTAFGAAAARRRRPDYYIFATNVVLTNPTDGGKDKAAAIVASFKPQLPLKGFALWDYDTMRVFIDGNEDVRRAYAAWITPGDVLHAALGRLEDASPRFDEIVDLYVQRGLLADQYARLEQAGASPEDNIPLANVFVDLPVVYQGSELPTAHDSRLNAIETILGHAQLKLDPVSAAAIPRAGEGEPGRFVLVGGPGQGKSTVGQFLCQIFRFSILHARERLPAEVRTALAALRTQLKAENLEESISHRFPVRVPLSDFADALASGQVSTVLGFVAQRMGRVLDASVSADDVRKWLAEYPWALVLDGLDEVPASSNRQDVLRSVQEFWVDAHAANADIFVLATTRPQGYNEDFGRKFYRHLLMRPLEPAAALNYARRLVATRYGADVERQQKIIARLERATESDATARLLFTPLQVTIMSTLVDRLGRPPQERWSLFNAYYDVIYQREVERDIPAAPLLRDHKADIDAIHQWVGLLLQIESERSGGTDARLTTHQLTCLVELRLRLEGHRDDDLRFLRDQVIEAAGQRLVFLVGLEEDAIGFELRSLQEFMAAEGVMAGRDAEVLARLTEVAHLAHWRNTFLFAAGKCFADRQHLRDSIYAVCSALDDDAGRPVARATRTGARLAADILADGPARRQPKYAQLFAKEALRALDLPPDQTQQTLADFFEPAVAHLFEERLSAHLERGDPRSQASSWMLLLALSARGVPLADQLIEKFKPHRDEDYADILRLGAIAGPQQFRQRLLLSLRHLSYFELLSFNWWFDSSLGDELARTADDDDIAPWQRGMLEIGRNAITEQTYPVRIPTTPTVIGLRLVTVTGISPDLSQIPDPIGGWAALAAAARFCAAPSAAQLGASMHDIISLFDRLPPWLRTRLPWPLAACLDAVTERGWQSAAAEMTEAAATGTYGDLDDWLGAEARWKVEGVHLDDFDAIAKEEAPIPSYISSTGFPFFVAALSPLRTPGAGALVEVFRELPEGRLRAAVASWLLELTRFRSYATARIREGFSDEVLAELVREAATYAPYLVVPEFEDCRGNEVLICSAIEDAARQTHVVGPYRPTRDLATILATAFTADPERLALAPVLATLATEISVRIPPELLPMTHPNATVRRAAGILRVSGGDWNSADASDLARQIVDNAHGDMWTVFQAGKAAMLLNSPNGDEFLVELLNAVESAGGGAEIRSRLVNLLTSRLQGIPSRLSDHGCLVELGFPGDLSAIRAEDQPAEGRIWSR